MDHNKGSKNVLGNSNTNSLLSAAASGFSLEESQALLVPVVDEPTPLPPEGGIEEAISTAPPSISEGNPPNRSFMTELTPTTVNIGESFYQHAANNDAQGNDQITHQMDNLSLEPGVQIDTLYQSSNLLSSTSSTTISQPILTSGTPMFHVTPDQYQLPTPVPTVTNKESGGNMYRMNQRKYQYAKYPGLIGASTPYDSSDAPSVPVAGANVNSMPHSASMPSMGTFGETPNTSFVSNPPVINETPVTQPRTDEMYQDGRTYHWFYEITTDKRKEWKPFFMTDSRALESAYVTGFRGQVSTEGGRYDVNLDTKERFPVYWKGAATRVWRCSWFYKGPIDNFWVPYDETMAEWLEAEFQEATRTGCWDRKLELDGKETIILTHPGSMTHYCKAAAPDEWENLPNDMLRPRIVKRGIEGIPVEDPPFLPIDHLVFVVHGIGAVCDFKFRTIEDAVDATRTVSMQLMDAHFKNAMASGKAGRIEFLPISWHTSLHGDQGIDERLKAITLPSIPVFRNFTNDTLLDILFYTSPTYCQTIITTVAVEINRLYGLFCSRNPSFRGNVGIVGHSLGSLIVFDLLTHQPERDVESSENREDASQDDANVVTTSSSDSTLFSYRVSSLGLGTGYPIIKYPKLSFIPAAFFAVGSPIAMFVTVRGIDKLGIDFHFPTCPRFFNIFHPFDPVAYRMETLIDPTCRLRPVQIPHHKGRKRIHYQMKEALVTTFGELSNKVRDMTSGVIGGFINKKDDRNKSECNMASKAEGTTASLEDLDDANLGLGRLNGGRRIDFVLQEAPVEVLNEYLFSLSSHVGYWESDDTILMIMRELYMTSGVVTDSETTLQPPNVVESFSVQQRDEAHRDVAMVTTHHGYDFYVQNSQESSSVPAPEAGLSVTTEITGQELIPPVPTVPAESTTTTILGARPIVSTETMTSVTGMDPTMPIGATTSLGPPPLSGFQKK